MYVNTFAFQAIPFVIGMLVKRHAGATAARWERVLSRLGLVSLLALTTGLLIAKGALLFEQDARAVLLLAACACVGIFSGLVVPTSPENQAALGLSTGIRNLSLSLLLAGTLATDAITVMMVLVYGLLQYAVGFPAAVLYRRRIPARVDSIVIG